MYESELKDGNPSKDHKRSLYVRITIDGIRSEISFGRKVCVDLWNRESGMLTDKSAESLLINRDISEVKLKLEKIYDLLEYQYSVVTGEMIKERYKGLKTEKRSLIEVVDFLISKSEKICFLGVYAIPQGINNEGAKACSGGKKHLEVPATVFKFNSHDRNERINQCYFHRTI